MRPELWVLSRGVRAAEGFVMRVGAFKIVTLVASWAPLLKGGGRSKAKEPAVKNQNFPRAFPPMPEREKARAKCVTSGQAAMLLEKVSLRLKVLGARLSRSGFPAIIWDSVPISGSSGMCWRRCPQNLELL